MLTRQPLSKKDRIIISIVIAGFALVTTAFLIVDMRLKEIMTHTTMGKSGLVHHFNVHQLSSIKTSRDSDQNTPDPNQEPMLDYDIYDNIQEKKKPSTIIVYKNGCKRCQKAFPYLKKYADERTFWVDGQTHLGKTVRANYGLYTPSGVVHIHTDQPPTATDLVDLENISDSTIKAAMDRTKGD